MPIFEYVCNKCGKEFEKLMRSGLPVACPQSASNDVNKKISLFAVASDSTGQTPACGDACEGYERGSCGSGMCSGHAHD
jgi:putative FmdB family regulatory protein